MATWTGLILGVGLGIVSGLVFYLVRLIHRLDMRILTLEVDRNILRDRISHLQHGYAGTEQQLMVEAQNKAIAKLRTRLEQTEVLMAVLEQRVPPAPPAEKMTRLIDLTE